MKKLCFIALILSFLAACKSPEKQLTALQDEAEEQSADIAQQVRNGRRESIASYTDQKASVIHILFDQRGAVYWSSNALNITHLPYVVFNEWTPFDFDNAEAQVYWNDLDSFRLMTVVPTHWHIHGWEEIENSFSYQPIRDSQEPTSWWQSSHVRVRFYFFILIGLSLLVLGTSIWMLVAARGFRNLSLRQKIMIPLSTMVILSFVIVGVSIMKFERKHYEEQQRTQLQQKSRYVQEILKKRYYGVTFLSSFDSPNLNADLHELGKTFNADIHIYDTSGRLIGSSTPGLFRHGLLNPIMDPQVYFSDQPTQVCYEHIGEVRYIAAFTEFVNGNGQPIGYIGIPFFISENDIAMEVDSVMARLLPPFILILILVLIVSYSTSRVLTQPIGKLIEKMKNFSLGQNNHIEYVYHDELGKLVERYNVMVDELEQTTRKLIHSEREGAWRTMARQIAHEINNPLTPMKLTVQQLQRLRGTDDFEDKFNKASQMLIEQIDNLSRIATSFSTFAKLPQVVTSEVDIAEKLSQAIMLQQNNSLHIPIRYLGPDSGLIALADREQIGQVFTNILKNAIQALEDSEEGDIIVILKDQDTQVEISVSDNGPGIPPEIQSKVFMPNFTTKSNGTGLGLAISKNIVEGSDGTIRFETSPKGTTFYIYLHKTPIV